MKKILIILAGMFFMSLTAYSAGNTVKDVKEENAVKAEAKSVKKNVEDKAAAVPAVKEKENDMETKIFKEIFNLDAGLYAIIRTASGNKPFGDLVIKLFPDIAPETVDNFVKLAKGEKEFTDASTGQKSKRPYYNGIIFHRVIKEFMIQGGDPTGTGRGGPGYSFGDEISPAVKFEKEGLLAMANAGPNTNGSQFFITVVKTPWLNGRHTIFGEVVAGKDMGLNVSGLDIVKKISEVKTLPGDRPEIPVTIEQVIIYDIK